MSRVMSWKGTVLSKVKHVQKVGEGSDIRCRMVVNMKVEITGDNEFGRGRNEIFKKRSEFSNEGGFRRGRWPIYIK